MNEEEANRLVANKPDSIVDVERTIEPDESNEDYQSEFSLVTWNVKGGGAEGAKIVAQMEALCPLSPHIVSLQEVRERKSQVYQSGKKRNDPEIYRQILYQRGLHCVSTFDRKEYRTCSGGLGQLIAWPSQWRCRLLAPWEGPHFEPARVLSVLLDTPWGTLEVHSAYAPHGYEKEEPNKKAEILEYIFDRLACVSAYPRILCGDFNLPYLSLPHDAQEQVRRESSRTLAPLPRKEGQVRRTRAEEKIFYNLADYDLVDVYRSRYEPQQLEWSYWSEAKDMTIGRYDHIYASESIGPKECRYEHEINHDPAFSPRFDNKRNLSVQEIHIRLSDHCPVWALFKPEKAFASIR